MLPLSLLKTSQGHPVMVELKNGETYNGTLLFCDSWMNLHLREVILSSRDGDKFYRLAEAYIRGNTIKYMRVADTVLEKAQEEEQNAQRESRGGPGRGYGGRGGRGGRGDGPGGRGDFGGRGGRGGDFGGRGGGRGRGRGMQQQQ